MPRYGGLGVVIVPVLVGESENAVHVMQLVAPSASAVNDPVTTNKLIEIINNNLNESTTLITHWLLFLETWQTPALA